jgi:hypothetical protein
MGNRRITGRGRWFDRLICHMRASLCLYYHPSLLEKSAEGVGELWPSEMYSQP